MNPHSKIADIAKQPLDEDNQVSLDSINVKLRVGEPLSFNFTVKPADNIPLDLYIIMDLSNTYESDLVQVKILAPSLANSLNNLTNDALIGFGTFVDKLTPPFTSQRQIDLLFEDSEGNPSCRDNEPCSLPVAFEHVSDLTNSSEEFNAALQDIIISTNADSPEGTLDAMMQATVCSELIGWRKNARKVLMVMTDDVVHTAGDGRLAGVTKINDAKCHTEYIEQYDKFLYTASTEYDYPSFEQLRLVLRENSIVPVFAVPSGNNDIVEYFGKIRQLLNGFIATTSADSSDLLDVVAEAYNNVVSQVTIDYDNPTFLETEVSLECPDGSILSSNGLICTEIGKNETQINMTLTLTECTSEVSNGNVYPLEVIIPGFDRFTIYIEGECSCECDNSIEIDPVKCVNGELRCGRCYCYDGWQQDTCDCPIKPCPMFNGLECGGRGTCDGCGSCLCNEIGSPQNGVTNPKLFGDACQCSNFECEANSDGNSCSGRGICECDNGMYSCNCGNSSATGESHGGDICQCSSDHCVDPNNSMNGICSGHGNCQSCEAQGSACSCDENYDGGYCEIFNNVSINNCGSADQDCIECYGKAAKDGQNAAAICNSNCQSYVALERSQSSDYEIPGTLNSSTGRCSISTVECSYIYFVGTTISSDLLYAVEPESCLPIPIWGIAVIIIVALLIIGIVILVIIKLCLMWLDYREYKRFMYDVNNADKTLQSNPVYQDPITHVDNPLHGKPI